MNQRSALLAAAMLAAVGEDALSSVVPSSMRRKPAPTPAQTARWRDQRGYPQTGSGKRQGERVARQVARAFVHPFEASNRCIERIKARLARA